MGGGDWEGEGLLGVGQEGMGGEREGGRGEWGVGMGLALPFGLSRLDRSYILP